MPVVARLFTASTFTCGTWAARRTGVASGANRVIVLIKAKVLNFMLPPFSYPASADPRLGLRHFIVVQGRAAEFKNQSSALRPSFRPLNRVVNQMVRRLSALTAAWRRR